MGYRVALAQDYDRDLPAAAALQEKLVALHRQQAAPALALPAAAPLDQSSATASARWGSRSKPWATSCGSKAAPTAWRRYQEAIGTTSASAKPPPKPSPTTTSAAPTRSLPAIRDLDAAEAAYRRSLALLDPNDALGRSRCIHQIGMVHHERFDEARQRGEPAAAVLQHAQAAEQHFNQALALCPPSAIADLGPMHNELGRLYADVGQIEPAREHYERAAQYFEQTGNRYDAGQTRYNLALMYRDAAERSRPRPAGATCCAARGLRPGQPARLPALPGPRRANRKPRPSG